MTIRQYDCIGAPERTFMGRPAKFSKAFRVHTPGRSPCFVVHVYFGDTDTMESWSMGKLRKQEKADAEWRREQHQKELHEVVRHGPGSS